MPKSSKVHAIARQWCILQCLSDSSRGVTVRELHEHLAQRDFIVTRRTVERDLEELGIVFPLTTTGKAPQAWRWMDSTRGKRILCMDPVEGLALVLAGEVLAAILPELVFRQIKWRFEAARKLLDHITGNRFAQWSQGIRYQPPGLQLQSPRIAPGIMESIQEALANGRVLSCRYRRAEASEPKNLVLHPLAIVLRGRTPYLLASQGEGGPPFLYALHRFEEAAMKTERAIPPPGFDLENHLNEGGAGFGVGKTIRLEAEVRDPLVGILRETPLSENQTMREKDGRTVITATVRESWELDFWILSQSENFTVLKPAALRTRVREKLEDALKAYSTP